jgi:hypothetical protein
MGPETLPGLRYVASNAWVCAVGVPLDPNNDNSQLVGFKIAFAFSVNTDFSVAGKGRIIANTDGDEPYEARTSISGHAFQNRRTYGVYIDNVSLDESDDLPFGDWPQSNMQLWIEPDGPDKFKLTGQLDRGDSRTRINMEACQVLNR